VPAADFLLEHMSRTFRDPVDPRVLGSLDARLQTRVNGEVYKFSSEATLARFRQNPTRWCGILRDPVSGVRFMPRRSSPQLETEDGPYFFESAATCRKFGLAPESYAIHRP
jgi:YHS domain-containing protein